MKINSATSHPSFGLAAAGRALPSFDARGAAVRLGAQISAINKQGAVKDLVITHSAPAVHKGGLGWVVKPSYQPARISDPVGERFVSDQKFNAVQKGVFQAAEDYKYWGHQHKLTKQEMLAQEAKEVLSKIGKASTQEEKAALAKRAKEIIAQAQEDKIIRFPAARVAA